jgi:GNAT superfamily N-acetyltransferase
MRIEAATVQDLPVLEGLLRAQFEEHAIPLDPRALSGAVRGLLSDEGRGAVLLARDPDPIGVAVLAYTWTLEHGGKSAWLDELFVVPEHRDRGVGRALLLRALQVAGASGCRAVDLEVDVEHARAEHLYAREGFAALPRKRWARRLGVTDA